MAPEGARPEGVFLAFQYPVEIPGVDGTRYFLRAAYNETAQGAGLDEIDPLDFLSIVEDRLKLVDMDPDMLSRSVNAGFSRRREEAKRDFADGRARTPAGDSRRDRFRDSTSTPCASWPAG